MKLGFGNDGTSSLTPVIDEYSFVSREYIESSKDVNENLLIAVDSFIAYVVNLFLSISDGFVDSSSRTTLIMEKASRLLINCPVYIPEPFIPISFSIILEFSGE